MFYLDVGSRNRSAWRVTQDSLTVVGMSQVFILVEVYEEVESLREIRRNDRLTAD